MRPWQHHLDLVEPFQKYEDDEITFEQSRDEIVRRIRGAGFWLSRVYDAATNIALNEIVTLLAWSDDEDEFSVYWNRFYDWCDTDKRVWVAVQGWQLPAMQQ